MRVPASVDQLTDAWISDVLGGVVSITRIERIGEGYGLASEIHRISLEHFAERTVVVKLWSFDGPADQTEVHFYREFGPIFSARLPRCFYGAFDEEGAVLVLEDICGRQGDVLVEEDRASLEAIVRLLATIHSTWWGDDRLGARSWLRDGRLPRGSDWVRDRRERFSDRHGRFSSSLANQLIDNADAALGVGVERLEVHPATLAHGDVHLDNILFVDTKPMLLDWAGCRRGPASQDLVAVLFGMGEPELIDPLLATYRTSLATLGVDLHPDSLERAVGGAVLWSFVYWTLGTASWIPSDDREEAMQNRHIEDAVAMVGLWAERDPSLFDEVVGRRT